MWDIFTILNHSFKIHALGYMFFFSLSLSQTVVRIGDRNKDGRLDKAEFLDYCEDQERRLWKVFQYVDSNRDGEIMHYLRACFFTKFKILIFQHILLFFFLPPSLFILFPLILGAIDLDEIKNKLNEIDIRISDEDARKLLKK